MTHPAWSSNPEIRRVEVEVLRRLGADLRDSREQRGLSREALAARAGLEESVIAGVEGGAIDPTVLQLSRHVGALQIASGPLLDKFGWNDYTMRFWVRRMP
jgi:ribosome-binding protein aMBF1 (putative translation factor)